MKKQTLFFTLLCFQLFLQAQEDAWVYLVDKDNVSSSLSNPITILTQKAIDRKNLHNITIDERDVPVNENYIAQLKAQIGITVMAKSKWFNAIHVRGTEINIDALQNLSFVSYIDYADKGLNTTAKLSKQKHQSKIEALTTTFNYGNALNQIEMFNGDELHVAGYTGTGMTVAVIDAGFPNVNTMASFQRLRSEGNLLGSYDFVNRRNDVYTNTASNHGTLVLSDMAGYVENQFVGTAPDASYYLFITEDAPRENPVEESYWVEATERADSLGVDVINTSLGYTTYDNPNYSHSALDMDGKTTFITKGANIAFKKGLLLVTSAGNSGNDSWGIVGAPADAAGVLSIGAVDASGDYAFFSSLGNATQPTQKPDVVAQGLVSYVITENDIIGTANGTSFSSPILAGGVTCLWQALPNKTNEEIMQLIRESGSIYTTPNFQLGYGIPNLNQALTTALLNEPRKEELTIIKIFPNPSNNILNVDFPDFANEAEILFYDVLGKLVFNMNTFSSKNSIDISVLSKGVYFLKISSNKNSKTFKFIKN